MIFLCIQTKHSTMIKAVICGSFSIEIWKNSITLVKNERGKTRRCYHAWLRTTQEAADITQEQFSFYPFYP